MCRLSVAGFCTRPGPVATSGLGISLYRESGCVRWLRLGRKTSGCSSTRKTSHAPRRNRRRPYHEASSCSDCRFNRIFCRQASTRMTRPYRPREPSFRRVLAAATQRYSSRPPHPRIADLFCSRRDFDGFRAGNLCSSEGQAGYGYERDIPNRILGTVLPSSARWK